ncbi:hypothetical protein CPT_Mansfield_001 [Escherichia phage Mansfield]|uniref:Uncharacterized protein n=1 Tax=Escherichia phage Mansfield TaxID=2591099 RepID=A0A5B9NBE0_9CAUD|nr:hypothetical protein CPT_Mansfield_001 [Escherichia phage Mansfield]
MIRFDQPTAAKSLICITSGERDGFLLYVSNSTPRTTVRYSFSTMICVRLQPI